MLQSQRLSRYKESLGLRLSGSGYSHPYFHYFVTLYFQYKDNGVLPFKGAHTEQPSKIIDIFNILDCLFNETKQEQTRAQEKLDKRQTNRNGKR